MAYNIVLLRAIFFAISSDMLYILSVTKKKKGDNRGSKRYVGKWKPLYLFVLFAQADNRRRFFSFFKKEKKKKKIKKHGAKVQH
jgi:hypothetical protein